MSQRQRRADSAREDVSKVRLYAPGTRFRCRDNGLTYQLGAKHGMSQFWMLQESPAHKGLVTAITILQHFEVIR